MASSDAQLPSQVEPRMYEAAESMLEHSRLPRPAPPPNINGYALPEPQLAQLQPQSNPLPLVPISPYPDVRLPFQNSLHQRPQAYATTIDGILQSPQGNNLVDYHHDSKRSGSGLQHSSTRQHRESEPSVGGSGFGNHNVSIDGSEPTSPTSSRGRNAHSSELGPPHKFRRHEEGPVNETEHEEGKPPPWSEMKTKAGKDRKRLPLACIACRRKKIRCSGEKPACKHCLRSRIPCVYKVTARKAAPRTDYMAMLDKRLKRMEERVIKIIPKDLKNEISAIPRAVVKPSHSGNNAKTGSGKKRAAGEAFGLEGNEWADGRTISPPQPLPRAETSYNEALNEGIEKLPSKEIQEHLSEVFFDSLYGQSYHLLHKPSYMRRLRAGTVPPVLVLAVCAISARFSTHPQINSEPAFLRGEEWANPAREIALKRYDEPSITTLTVFLLLGLHEFGTCQGGRSWMFGGMALRMAYALQLHRELDHDPLRQQDGKKAVLNCTDREIRRRTMWACFLMDRFNSSGTERPASANEDNIKIQLPIKETYFQMDLSGPTEFLDGSIADSGSASHGQMTEANDNMGVAAHIIRIIALYGRLVKYINLGGREQDGHPVWDAKSQFAELRKQAEGFRASLPVSLRNTPENLKKHAAEKLANQFLMIHIAANQVMLFLHRFAIPTAPGGSFPKEAPKAFVTEARTIAIDAATNISALLDDAMEHHVTAPFTGYCAFMSSAVHVWGSYSKIPTLEASSKANLARNVKYLHKMKKHWGMFHFILQNLKEIFHHQVDGPRSSGGKETAEDAPIFQYGDWFRKFPHGVSKTDFEDGASKEKQEAADVTTLSQESELQSVEDFFHKQSPPTRVAQPRKVPKKRSRSDNQAEALQPLQPLQIMNQPNMQRHHQTDPTQPMLPLSAPIVQSPISPSFTPQQPNIYNARHSVFPSSYDLHSMVPPNNTHGFPQPLERHVLYGGYTGADSVPTAVSALDGLDSGTSNLNPAMHDPSAPQNQMWSATSAMDLQQQMMASAGGYGDMATGGWFLPFNMDPPDIGSEGDLQGFVGDQGMRDAIGGMPQQ